MVAKRVKYKLLSFFPVYLKTKIIYFLIGHKQNTRYKENDENLDPAERISFSDCSKKRKGTSYTTGKILFKYEA